jgi:hypothetical protein
VEESEGYGAIDHDEHSIEHNLATEGREPSNLYFLASILTFTCAVVEGSVAGEASDARGPSDGEVQPRLLTIGDDIC